MNLKNKIESKKKHYYLFQCKNYEEEYAKLSETVEILERCGFKVYWGQHQGDMFSGIYCTNQQKNAINQMIYAYNRTCISDDYDIEFIAKNDYKAYKAIHKNN